MLLRPLGSTDLLEHVKSENRHAKVDLIETHKSQEVVVKPIVTVVPVYHLLCKLMTVNLTNPSQDNDHQDSNY